MFSASRTALQAAVIAVSGVTALQGVRDTGRVQAGQRVLVIGASGGVGTYAVQLAKAFGAQVTGVCSAAKMDLVRSIGTDEVIDYATVDFAESGRHYDLIMDIGGLSSFSRLRRALMPSAIVKCQSRNRRARCHGSSVSSLVKGRSLTRSVSISRYSASFPPSSG